jgi:hypothetical protein
MTYTPDPGPESRFTASSPGCWHPERWTSDDTDSTEHEVSELVGAFVRALQPDYCIETGTAWGQTAQRIGEALKANGQGTLDTLEPDRERANYAARRCDGLPVAVVRSESLEWFPPGKFIGFAWFDSLIALRVPEFRHFRQWMTGDTVVGFHDSADHHGLRPGIEALAGEGLLAPIFLPTPRGVCFARVL